MERTASLRARIEALAAALEPEMGHEPTCHGDSPEERGWCCQACCEVGQSLPGHWACTPTRDCGQRITR